MVKNTKGGKHHKKGKKHRGEEKTDGKIIYAENNQVYACVTKKVGGSRLNINCSDTKDRSGLIPGKFFKRVWMNVGDIILCELNPDDDTQCYILHKYSYKDASLLKSQGHITFNVIDDSTNDDTGFDFGDSDNELEDQNTNNKMLDIKNVKNKPSTNSDSGSDNDLEQINNHGADNSKKSTKWSKKKDNDEDQKEYTIDDL